MTEFSPARSAARTATDTEPSVKDRATDVAQSGKQAASVAQTAAGAAKDVAEQTKQQAGDLIGKTKSQLAEQASSQQSALVESLRSLGDQLAAMTDNVDQDGTAVELAGQAGVHARSAADWLDEREPNDVLEELRRLGRDRPAAFLLGAALAGVVAGRLTRGVVAAHVDDNGGSNTDVNAGSDGTISPRELPTSGAPALPSVSAAPGVARHQPDPVRDTPGFGMLAGKDPSSPLPQGPLPGGLTQP